MVTIWSRRRLLQAGAVTGIAGLAGCTSGPHTSGTRDIADCSPGRSVHEFDTAVARSASWPLIRHDPANTGYNPEASGPRSGVEVAWRYDVCEASQSGIIVGGRRAHVGGSTIDARTGEAIRDEFSRHQRTPALFDGSLFVGWNDLEARNPETGEVQWTFETDVDGGLVSAPVVDEDTVYVLGSVNDDTLYAVDAARGTERWRFETEGFIVGTPAIVDGAVYLVDKSSTVYSIDAETGAERWRALYGTDRWRSLPVVVDGVIYLGAGNDTVLAVSTEDGSEVWRTAMGEPDHIFGAPVAVADGTVFATGGEGALVALDATGGEITWQATTGAYQLGPPAIAGNVVYVGSAPGVDPGTVFAFDVADGTKLWRYQTRTRETEDGGRRSGIVNSPIVVDDVVYVMTVPGDLYALTEIP